MKDLTADRLVLCCKQMDKDECEHMFLGHLNNSTSILAAQASSRFKIMLDCQSMSVTKASAAGHGSTR